MRKKGGGKKRQGKICQRRVIKVAEINLNILVMTKHKLIKLLKGIVSILNLMKKSSYVLSYKGKIKHNTDLFIK